MIIKFPRFIVYCIRKISKTIKPVIRIFIKIEYQPKNLLHASGKSNNSLHRRFKILLLQKNIPQCVLAEQVGISEYLLSHIITGKRRGLPYRQKICKILDVSEKELWNGNK